MLEWKLIDKLVRNPKVVKAFNIFTVSHPLIRKGFGINVINHFKQDEKPRSWINHFKCSYSIKWMVIIIIMKFYTVLTMMNIEYFVKFVMNFVLKDIIKTICNHKLILIIFIKDNSWIKINCCSLKYKYVTNVAGDYNNITLNNYIDILNDYSNSSLSNCRDSEFIIDIIIPSLLLTKPCDLSFLCMLSLMVYTIIKPLFKIK